MADALAREKNVDKNIVFEALEQALAQATKRQYKERIDARVALDRETGDYDTFRVWHIVTDEEFVDPDNQMMLREAHEFNPELEMGGVVEEPIPPVDFGRIGAQAAKQAILQRVRDAEREQQLQEFLSHNDSIVSGIVRRIERGDVVIESGKIEARITRDQLISKENMRVGDRVRAFISRIDRTARGPQIFLSRVSNEFLAKLFEFEVPEIEEKIIEIKAVARDPGLRAKIAVKSNDKRVDAQGTCIGMRGARVNAVTNELSGERVDVILWSDDPAQFVINALAPAVINRITVDEDKHAMDVVVDDENLAVAIGRGGQNVRLATELTGWKLNLMSEQESESKQQVDMQKMIENFMAKLDVDQEVAQILVEEGFSTLEEVAYVPLSELQSIESFDETTVQELRTRARNAVLTAEIAKEESLDKVDDSLRNLPGLNAELIPALAQNGVFTANDVADLATDELVEYTGLDNNTAKALIMEARKSWDAV
jgi:transcription termination/antitermination protein NusA